MELTIALILSILGSVISISNFVLSRKDKAIKDTKENHQELIEYQLKELKDDVKAILNKLEKYDKEFDDRIDKAIELHVELYHKRGE
jgi:peptidoglycan hydrolase CwlO-like protein